MESVNLQYIAIAPVAMYILHTQSYHDLLCQGDVGKIAPLGFGLT